MAERSDAARGVQEAAQGAMFAVYMMGKVLNVRTSTNGWLHSDGAKTKELCASSGVSRRYGFSDAASVAGRALAGGSGRVAELL